jgi:hypothetical protein
MIQKAYGDLGGLLEEARLLLVSREARILDLQKRNTALVLENRELKAKLDA